MPVPVAGRRVNRPIQPPVQSTASLNTNEELERLLDRADQLVSAGRSDLVPVLWQRVLDEAGDVLASQGGGKEETRLHVYQRYRPLREEVIRRMVAAGPDALKAYRLQMDGVAKSRLSDDSVSREAALADVVQRLLLTSSGPHAAFESACLRLEQGDYLSAVRLLTAVEQCPEHGLAPAAVTARLSVALARLGALSAARERLTRDATVSAELRTLLETDFARFTPTKSHSPTVAASSDSLLPDRDAVLQEGWRQTLAYTLKAPVPQPATGGSRTVVANMNGRRVVLQMDGNGRLIQPNANDAAARDLKPGELVTTWTDAKWQPVGRAQLVGNRVLVKSQERLLCLDLATSRTLWMGRKNNYPHAPQSVQTWQWQLMGADRASGDGVRRPQTLTEIALFGDQVPQLMTVSDDLVFNVEGQLGYLTPPAPDPPANAQRQQRFNPFLGDMPGAETARRTWLAAYELTTGKLRWHRGSGDNDQAATGFVSAPVALNDLVVAAVNDGQRLSLSAHDRQTGQVRWRTALCDLPSPGVSPWSPVGLAVDRGDLFVSTGAGAVFFVSGLDGSVRLAATYPRKLPTALAAINPMFDANAAPMTPTRAECRENRVLPVDDQLLVLATDFDHLFSLDRRTGAVRWEAPLNPRVRSDAGVHCLGISGRMLIMAGAASVRGYDVRGGRIAWEVPVAGSFGRGTVTDQAVYVPVEHKVLKLNSQTGEQLASLTLQPADGAPVGNLFVDGERVVVLGAGQVSMWNRVPPKSEEATP
ncbi:MAG: PQQ-binding-like beta-propeller repeat protein [Planctomycetaceae bacterium]|nr:PQQ-binding-like beta-propeller repeat protein [Planctomycetaceae bacterium]